MKKALLASTLALTMRHSDASQFVLSAQNEPPRIPTPGKRIKAAKRRARK